VELFVHVMLHKVMLTFGSVVKIIKCDHSKENS